MKQNSRVLPNFQLKQGIDSSGQKLQNTFPKRESRFLNKDEITALQESSDRYRAFRSLNLRELNFSRLLDRNEFPYDQRHRARELNTGEPLPREDLFYNVEKNQFVKIEKAKPPEVLMPEPIPEISTEEGNNLATEPLKNNKQERIIEFLYDIFQENEKTSEPSSFPEESDAL